MKFYKRQIRPMINPPAFPVMRDKGWYDEDYEDVLTSVYEGIVKEQGYMNELCFDERYVEVELPDIQTLNIKPGDVILFHFNPDEFSYVDAVKYVERYQTVIPKNCPILLVPHMQAEIMDKETAYACLDKWEKDIEQL